MAKTLLTRSKAKAVAIPLPSVRRALLAWYDAHGRELPWRRTSDPYCVWVSEVMLQQTRVAAVVDYYQRFLARFPTIHALAAASEADVLARWSGLGYYRRARMLHAAAKFVVDEFGGKVPNTEVSLRKLPGIGRYTAAAIASIAFGEATAVVDGNVERVLSRIQGAVPASGEIYWQTANVWLSRKRPGDWNQAMMELGATVCLPGEPKCLVCPVRRWCATQGQLPSEKKKDKRQKRELTLLLAKRVVKGEALVFLVQRGAEESLMAGMWQLPEAPADSKGRILLRLRHSITVNDYDVRVIRARIVSLHSPNATVGRWVKQTQLSALPLTGLARKILRTAGPSSGTLRAERGRQGN